MRSADLERPRGNQESRRRAERSRGPGGGQLLQPQRTRHLSASFPWWYLTLAGAAIASGEWLRAPSRLPALLAVGLLLLTAAVKRRGWLLLPLFATTVLVGIAEWRIERLRLAWPSQREARIEAASGRLQSELRDAGRLADSLASKALAVAELPREGGFERVAALVRGSDVEAGIVVFERGAAPRIWGGRFRVLPSPTGDSVGVQLTPYYAVLEVRRHGASGRTALGAVLLSAAAVVPDPERSLAARFRERTEVGLRILPTHAAPDISDVFDYEQPTNSGTQILFSVQFVPPDQADAVVRSETLGTRRVAWALVLTLLAAVWLVPAGWGRAALGLLPILLAVRAPLGVLLGLQEPFNPAVFRSGILGPVSSSAGPLALAGCVLILTGALLWERGGGEKRWSRRLAMLIAGVLLLGAPYLLADLGRGIVPPATGVPVGLWLVWHLTLFLAAAGLVTMSVGLVRRRDRAPRGWVAPMVAAGISLAAAAIGVEVWNAAYGWPGWYTALWLPPLVLLTWPADRRATIIGIAVVAGSAAALLAWGTEIEGRLKAARVDMAALSESPNPGIEAALRDFGGVLRQAAVPRTTAELYALWKASSWSRAGHPAVLGVWRPDGTPTLELRLDELDLPHDLLGALVRNLRPTDSISVLPLQLEPAVHHLLMVRRDTTAILTLALGPRTALVAPSRLGRLLGAPSPRTSLYRLTLAPAPSIGQPSSGLERWRREGRRARGQRTVTIAGIPRDVFGTVELGAFGMLAVRGMLVVVLDAAVLAVLWLLAELLGGHAPRRPRWMPRLRSYEARLGAALAVFFLLPTAGFAAWGMGRLRTEVRDSRDRMIEQSLRDVIPMSDALPANDPALTAALRQLGERADADFALYRDAKYVAGSTGGLLEVLGLLGPLVDPEAFHRIVIDGEAVASAMGPSRAVATRVGHRAVGLSDLGAGILAMPQVAFDAVLDARQRDLAMLFLLATLAGVAGSLLAARFAARALSRPVADLQAAALAFGRGEPVPPLTERPPLEFKPVFTAFEKMTADVRRARDAQERVARIVAWGEMANQVAHEIKNPLTPMRLGVQHLRRVHEDGRLPIGPVLESTTARILSEIDRLDRIARSFSRFGVPASERGPLETVKLPSVVRDVAELYRLGPEGAEIVFETESPIPAAARSDEVKEALVNLLENSRNARARLIRIRISGTIIAVEDDGRGISATLLPMVFEPRFSTSTSGSGLGLPIVKRLVEGWGGRVEIESQEGKGTVVRMHLVPATEAGPGSARPVG